MNGKLKKMILAALFAALCCVATIVVQIPSPTNGYLHLGDCAVLLSGVLLGRAYGAAAAAIGSTMADVITGYAHYAVATFIIKAIMAAAAWAVYSALGKGILSSALRLGIAGVVSELIMTVGYFAYDCQLRGQGLAAAASIPNYVIQGGIGIVAAVIIIKALERTPILSAGKAGV